MAMPKKKTQPVMGRPTLYDPAINTKIEDWMAKGYSLESAAIKVGIGPRTVFEWLKKHPEFRQSVDSGRAKSTAFWEERLLDGATGGGGNSALIQFGLRNRSKAASGWNHDIQKIEHTGPDGGPIQTESKKILDASMLARLSPEAMLQLESVLIEMEQAEDASEI